MTVWCLKDHLELIVKVDEEVEPGNRLDIRDGRNAILKNGVQRAAMRTDLRRVNKQNMLRSFAAVR
jgi:hypothetical protein